jgi:hypothetical protein
MAGYKHKQISGNIPVPHGHTPAWTHGFTAGYIAPKDTGYTDGWPLGRNAFEEKEVLSLPEKSEEF